MHPSLDPRHRPYFLWDYDLTYADVEAILGGDDPHQRLWVIGRILECARWEDIWKLLAVEDVRQALPHLRLRGNLKHIWEIAIKRWTYGG